MFLSLKRMTAGLCLALGSTALVSVGAPPTRHDPSSDRAEILRIYEATRRAHFALDAAGMVSAYADTLRVVSGGAIHVTTRRASVDGVRRYLVGRRFLEVSDVDSPVIAVSGDGTQASLLGHVRVRGTVADTATGQRAPFAFTASWIDVYAKRAGRWQIVARANTEHME